MIAISRRWRSLGAVLKRSSISVSSITTTAWEIERDLRPPGPTPVWTASRPSAAWLAASRRTGKRAPGQRDEKRALRARAAARQEASGGARTFAQSLRACRRLDEGDDGQSRPGHDQRGAV